MKHLTFAAIVASLLGNAPASAQPLIDPSAGQTLDALVASALAESPEILATRAEIDVARGHLQQAGVRPNPTLTAAWREQTGGSDRQTSLMLQVPLDLFRRDGRVAAAAANVAVAELSVADRERIFMAAIRDRAGAALLAARLLAVTDDLLTVNRRTRDLLAARVSEGATPPVERDVAEVEVRRLEAERAHRAADTDAAVLALKAALGLSADAPLTLRDDLEQQVRKETTPIETTSIPLVENRSDVREAAARVTAAEARAEQLRREARFDLSFYGSYMRMDASFPQRGLGPGGIPEPIHGVFHYAELGGMVMLPIFNRNQGTIAAAESERRAAELARQSRALVARAEAGAALIHAHHAIEAIDHARVARDLARRNVDVIRESYQLGRNTLFEVFVEQRRLVEVEMTYADTLAAAFQARTALIRATGATP